MSTEHPLILVVDDEPDICDLIKDILQDENYRVTTAGNGEQARTAFADEMPDLILLDIWMPDVDGISLLEEFKLQNKAPAIVMMSGHGTIETAVEATRLGAADFVEKPLSTAKLLRGVELALANKAAVQHEQAQVPVGRSATMEQLRDQIGRIAKHNAPLLLSGEVGSGKHCFARYLHSLGNYANGKFIELSPESFPLDSLKLKTLSQYNCVFISDVDLLSENAQALLLHLLNSHQLENCQLICASEPSLENNGFLEKPLYQVISLKLAIPPLREHIEDIPELVHHFIDLKTTLSDLPYRRFTVAAQNRLRNHSWPGNVQELKNIVQRLLILGEADDIDVGDVEVALQEASEAATASGDSINFNLPLREAREQFERIYLLKKLLQTEGNVGKAAKLAGMERTHLYRKLRSLGIDTKQI